MKRILLVLGMMLGWVPAIIATTIYSDAANVRYITNWTMATSPNVEYHIGDGLDFDTTGTVFDNYGTTVLGVGLTAPNVPALAEGPLSAGQSGVAFNGTTNYLTILDNTALRPTTNDFGVLVWVRWTSALVNTNAAIGKYDLGNNNREWVIFLDDGITAGQFRVIISADGTNNNRRVYGAQSAYNDGRWHLIGFTWVADSLAVFADGVGIVVTKTFAGSVSSIFSGTANPTVGCVLDGGVASTFAVCDLAWAGYWQGAGTPTAAEITAIYTAMAPTGAIANGWPSIQAAVYQGSATDTILILAGTYRETITIATAFNRIWASNTTFGNWPVLRGTGLLAASGTVGMLLSADNEVGFLEFHGYSAAGGIGLQANATSDGSLIHHLVIDSCLKGVNFVGACANDSLINVTVDGAALVGGSGVDWTTNPGGATSVVVTNCVIYNCVTGLTENLANATFVNSYCDFFGNTANYGGSAAARTGDIAVNPRFRNIGGNDYRPRNVTLKVGIAVHSQAAPFDQVFIGAWWPEALLNGGQEPLAWGRSGVWAGR